MQELILFSAWFPWCLMISEGVNKPDRDQKRLQGGRRDQLVPSFEINKNEKLIPVTRNGFGFC